MYSSFTATPLNILYIDKYTQWAIDFANKNCTNKTLVHEWFLNPQPVMGNEMNMNSIPPTLQQVIKDKYGEESRIAKIMAEFDVQKCLYMINYINFHDMHRKTNWKTTFPELVEYFDVEQLSPSPRKKVWEIKLELPTRTS